MEVNNKRIYSANLTQEEIEILIKAEDVLYNISNKIKENSCNVALCGYVESPSYYDINNINNIRMDLNELKALYQIEYRDEENGK